MVQQSQNNLLMICDDGLVSSDIGESLILNGEYAVTFESTSEGGLAALKQANFDVIIIKFGMTDIDSFELIRKIKRNDPDAVIIVFISKPRVNVAKELLRLGVYDIITRPINPDHVVFLMKKGVELRTLLVTNRKFMLSMQEQNVSLQKQNVLLAKRIEASTKNLSRLYDDLRTTYMRTIKALAQAIDARDHYTHSHSENVARYATAIAEEIGLSVREIELLREACELHDLGKIGIEDSILTKPSELTEKEWEQIKRHPTIGAQILEPLTFLSGVIDLVKQHHEHFDGSGYPEGRAGENILLGARILNLADSYEAMRSARSYRPVPFTREEAIEEIKRNRGKQFDPQVVDAFLRVVHTLDV